MVMRVVRTEGSESGKRERAVLWREAGEELSEKVTLEKDLRDESWEHLKEGCSWQKKEQGQRPWGRSAWSFQGTPVRSVLGRVNGVWERSSEEAGREDCEGTFCSLSGDIGFD